MLDLGEGRKDPGQPRDWIQLALLLGRGRPLKLSLWDFTFPRRRRQEERLPYFSQILWGWRFQPREATQTWGIVATSQIWLWRTSSTWQCQGSTTNINYPGVHNPHISDAFYVCTHTLPATVWAAGTLHFCLVWIKNQLGKAKQGVCWDPRLQQAMGGRPWVRDQPGLHRKTLPRREGKVKRQAGGWVEERGRVAWREGRKQLPR